MNYFEEYLFYVYLCQTSEQIILYHLLRVPKGFVAISFNSELIRPPNVKTRNTTIRLLAFIAFVVCICRSASAQKIYSVERPYQANLKVFVVDKDYKADLVVYKTDKDYKAKANENKGIWYFCDHDYKADKKVYFVDKEYQADLKVFFTDKDYRAGWKKNAKKPLLY